jgi:hypothetical protein
LVAFWTSFPLHAETLSISTNADFNGLISFRPFTRCVSHPIHWLACVKFRPRKKKKGEPAAGRSFFFFSGAKFRVNEEGWDMKIAKFGGERQQKE